MSCVPTKFPNIIQLKPLKNWTWTCEHKAAACYSLVSFTDLKNDLIPAGDPVFLDAESATSFMSRSLLANHWDFELVVKGDLQRECIDETCNYEEAREIFEDDEKTVRILRVHSDVVPETNQLCTDESCPENTTCLNKIFIHHKHFCILPCYSHKSHFHHLNMERWWTTWCALLRLDNCRTSWLI